MMLIERPFNVSYSLSRNFVWLNEDSIIKLEEYTVRANIDRFLFVLEDVYHYYCSEEMTIALMLCISYFNISFSIRLYRNEISFSSDVHSFP